MNTKVLLFCVCALLTTGCTTVHFDNGSYSEPSTTKAEWHHNLALALYEASAPVNLKDTCGTQQWTSVKTELTFPNVIAGGVVNFVAPIWYPKTVEVSCK